MSGDETSVQPVHDKPVTLGDMISLFYEEYLELNLSQGMERADAEELASVMAAATVNEMLALPSRERPEDDS